MIILGKLNSVIFFIVVIGLCFPATLPLFEYGFPGGHDMANHLYRSLEHYLAIQEGRLFPRWSAHVAGGYGLPIFHYYSPLFYYLTDFFRIIGFGYALSFEILIGTLLIAAGAGTGYLVRSLFGFIPGILSALFFVYSPYFLAGAYIRGNMPELTAAVTGIWALAFLVRYIRRSSIFLFCGAVLFSSALILSHNITALMLYPLLIVFGVFAQLKKREELKNRIRAASIVLITAVGLSAFFWLPALLETGHAHLKRLETGPYIWEQNFIRPNQWIVQKFEPVAAVRKDGIKLIPVQLGYAQSITFVLFLVLFLYRTIRGKKTGPTSAAVGIVTLAALFMTLEQSRFLWENMPFIRLFQFPWRFLLAASLGMAVAGGIVINHLSVRLKTIWIAALSALPAALAMWGALPYVKVYPFIQNNGIAPAAKIDQLLLPGKLVSSGKTTTTANEFLPRKAKRLPPSEERISIIEGDATIRDLRVESHEISMHVEAEKDSILRFEVYYFPGWRLMFNNASIPVKIDNAGRIIARLSKNSSGKLKLYFGSTRLRTFAGFISLISLAGVALIILLNRYRSDMA